MDDWLDLAPDPAHVRRERAKARELRKTDWWRALVAKGECHYCHRVVGAGGRLTGYAGGLARKARLLELEQAGLAEPGWLDPPGQAPA